MTDRFALLAFARRPWIDVDELKAKYHARTLELHPDASASDGSDGSDESFAELNDAYQTLREPRLRLQHLVLLHEGAADKSPDIPAPIGALFPRVGETIHRVTGSLTKLRSATNALARGMLQAEVMRERREVEKLVDELTRLEEEANRDLARLDENWSNGSITQNLAEARRLQLIYSYAGKWSEQLRELQFQLSQE